ncbi:MAG: AAA family ATPase [Bdellovibrionota bacterium]
MYNRLLLLENFIEDQHLLLLGPRQTGKSTFLKKYMPQALYIDLLDGREYLALNQNPNILEERIRAFIMNNNNNLQLVIIDEIQKIPLLLDEAHRLTNLFKQIRFIFTGSSARKLRTKGTNLLGGRAAKLRLYPIVSAELVSWSEKNQPIEELLYKGGLPSVLQAKNFENFLESYVGVYLQEEIAAEGAVRSLPNFARFLTVAALSNGEQINFASIASDTAIPARTIHDYFQILQDTLIGDLLEPYRTTVKRKSVHAHKFYFFDVGVANILKGTTHFQLKTTEFGKQLEHLVYCELKAALDYLQIKGNLFYWREKVTGHEVDFIIEKKQGDIIAIEVKGTNLVSQKDLKGLQAFEETCNEKNKLRKICVSSEAFARTTKEGVEIIPYAEFFKRLWNRNILD